MLTWAVPGASLHPATLQDNVGTARQFLEDLKGCGSKLLVFITPPEKSLAKDYGEAKRSKTFRSMLEGFENEFHWLPTIRTFIEQGSYSTTPGDGLPEAMEDSLHYTRGCTICLLKLVAQHIESVLARTGKWQTHIPVNLWDFKEAAALWWILHASWASPHSRA